jgi:2-polyprenyl-3-methyl-5-hydroxy-6-metoxy-1,4-benzoquinol methylase
MRDTQRNAYTPGSWETVPCPACLSEQFRPYETFGHRQQYRYVRCCDCGLFYSSPRPRYDQHFLDSCYADYEQFVDGATEDELRAIRTSSLTMFEKEVAHLVKFDRQRTAVLDIGSAMGTFLLAAKPHYAQLTGLDVSAKMAAFVRQELDVEVRLEQFHRHQPEQPYSLIHMSHVIEHVPNPNQWLQHARALLAPGGILVVNVPNKLSYSNVLKHMLWKLKLKKHVASGWADPARTPDHLFEPTLASFRALFGRHGFDILDEYSYSRRDPVSTASRGTRLLHRRLKWGNNLGFILAPRNQHHAAQQGNPISWKRTGTGPQNE